MYVLNINATHFNLEIIKNPTITLKTKLKVKCDNLMFWCSYFYVTCLQSDPAHFYGFAYFRQVKDPSIQRGYFQKVCYINLKFHCKVKGTCTLKAKFLFSNQIFLLSLLSSIGLLPEIQKGGIVLVQKISTSPPPHRKELKIPEGWGGGQRPTKFQWDRGGVYQ